MTVALDTVLRVGDMAVTAVVEQKVQAFHAGDAPSFHGTKRPLAILIRRSGVTLAFDATGRALELDAFDRRYPGQRQDFEQQAVALGEADRGA
ncbi:hypothetical protein [Dichotomicrobium thermohalophilum]|uniref:Uncharacterized protein n=1 Tax=Dichotomicrobium thermohalophilum TaxID=933063 RepID=A0A397PKA4_9HYPH|nr:hypothetical protein [Dichotomicrobium thermohalophilum]RIA47577.1 hypothetical protein BXY53_2132 [Dichotomicrobium thermohalophilum]